MNESVQGVSLSERKGDIFFVVCFAFFAFSSFFSDALHGLGLIHGEGFWAEANRWYAKVADDQFFLNDNLWVQYATTVSGFLQAKSTRFSIPILRQNRRGADWGWPFRNR